MRIASKSLLPQTVLLMVAIVWGINAPVIKLGLRFLPPQPYNLARLVVASIVALVALWLSGTHRRPSRADLGKLLRISALGFFVFQLLFTEGIQRTTAGNVSFILCLMPVSVLLLNKAFGLEPVTRGIMTGVACSILGVGLIIIGAGGSFSLASAHATGSLLILGSQAGYAYYTAYSKELRERYSTYQITAYLMVFTTVLLLVVTIPQWRAVQWTEVGPVAWGSILFSGILGLCVSNFLWIWGTSTIGTSRTAIFNNLSPVFAVVTAYFMLGETFGIVQVGGAALVFLGVYVTGRRQAASVTPA